MKKFIYLGTDSRNFSLFYDKNLRIQQISRKFQYIYKSVFVNNSKNDTFRIFPKFEPSEILKIRPQMPDIQN